MGQKRISCFELTLAVYTPHTGIYKNCKVFDKFTHRDLCSQ